MIKSMRSWGAQPEYSRDRGSNNYSRKHWSTPFSGSWGRFINSFQLYAGFWIEGVISTHLPVAGVTLVPPPCKINRI